MNKFNHPLMADNVSRDDINKLIEFLSRDPIPRMTNGDEVQAFEKEWGEWQGCPYNTMVNSGSMANEISLLAVKELLRETPKNEVILSPLGWVSDVAAVIHAGLEPVFCDINLRNFSIDVDDFYRKITRKTAAVILVHVLGFNGINDDIINICQEKEIILIEDVCESHGATYRGKKVGNFGHINNFSYFFAHHLCSLAEGGMIGVKDADLHGIIRAMRSHGMLREMPSEEIREAGKEAMPDLNPDFIFIAAAHNGRSQEVNAVVARNQLKRLDENNKKRADNFERFINGLDGNKYMNDLDIEGNSNYAFTLVLRPELAGRWEKVAQALKDNGIEFRRGLSGGGNQVRQPYLDRYGFNPYDFPNTEHVHFNSAYIGNYPSLETEKIDKLLEIVNNLDI